jgi:hypothetical protein
MNPWLTPHTEPPTKAGYSNGVLIHRKPEPQRVNSPHLYRKTQYHSPTAAQGIVLSGSINLDLRPPADKRSAMRKASI